MKKPLILKKLARQIAALEQEFVTAYKQAIDNKINQKELVFFQADEKMSLIANEICVLSGKNELNVKERLLQIARESYQ